MALTPFLAETGKVVASKLDELYPEDRGPRLAAVGPSVELSSGPRTEEAASSSGSHGGGHSVPDPVVICGFSPAGQVRFVAGALVQHSAS
jgi:hypothetical protein